MDVFDLFAKITLDSEDYERQLRKASDDTNSFADKLKSGLATAGKVAVAGLAATATAIAGLGKASIESYSEYEQLVGGVETLFGDSADAVMGYAENAFKTAGLSANEYMSTVTSFSASLLQSLGGDTEAAAQYANQAITDMSDNANKMGTSMESIQNAYQGFAKQNYTMLDNLKLGYGGTKEEMERLLQDADALSESFNLQVDESGNLVYSYADIVDAIHIVQTEMGITGTTAAEASSTIQGSVDSTKAAWKNLVTGFTDANADMDKLFNDFVESAETAAKNIVPAIGRAVTGILKLLEEKGPDMIAEGVILLGKLAVGLIQGIPDLVRKIPEIVKKIVGAFTSRSSEFSSIGKDIVRGIWNGISAMANWITDKVSGFFGGLVDGAKDVLGIHSPSKVFASIGGYMAEGLGEGWGDGYKDVKRQIENGMDFGTASIDFASSGMGKNSGAVASAGSAMDSRPIVITVQAVLDGKVIYEGAYQYVKNKERMYGKA